MGLEEGWMGRTTRAGKEAMEREQASGEESGSSRWKKDAREGEMDEATVSRATRAAEAGWVG